MSKEGRRLTALVPEGNDILWSAEHVTSPTDGTTEDGLRNLGKEHLGSAITPNYGWGEKERTVYIADPIGNSSHGINHLSKLLFEQRWVPKVPAPSEEAYIIYDLDEPAVAIKPIAERSSANSK